MHGLNGLCIEQFCWSVSCKCSTKVWNQDKRHAKRQMKEGRSGRLVHFTQNSSTNLRRLYGVEK